MINLLQRWRKYLDPFLMYKLKYHIVKIIHTLFSNPVLKVFRIVLKIRSAKQKYNNKLTIILYGYMSYTIEYYRHYIIIILLMCIGSTVTGSLISSIIIVFNNAAHHIFTLSLYVVVFYKPKI